MVLLFLRCYQLDCFNGKPFICFGCSPNEGNTGDYLPGPYLSTMDCYWNGNRIDGLEPIMVVR